MDVDSVYALIADHCFGLHPSDGFNPYADYDPSVDLGDCIITRRNHLRAYLDSLSEPRIILVGEAPGPWGARFSGVPFTSEAQLCDPFFPINGQRTTVRNEPYSEVTANVVWYEIMPRWRDVMLWNIVPYHPCYPDRSYGIRSPSGREVRMHAPLAEAIIDAIEPERVVAVGRKAEKGLSDAVYVRHPSHGGSIEFVRQLAEVFKSLD